MPNLKEFLVWQLQLMQIKDPEWYLGPCQISTMQQFMEIINGFQSLTIFAKSLTLDVWQRSKNRSESSSTENQIFLEKFVIMGNFLGELQLSKTSSYFKKD